jgi:hypothetical protein
MYYITDVSQIDNIIQRELDSDLTFDNFNTKVMFEADNPSFLSSLSWYEEYTREEIQRYFYGEGAVEWLNYPPEYY